MTRGHRVVVRHGLRQTLLAMLMGFQNIVFELVRKRHCLPEQDQGREQPGR
ncbi:MAG: hypothetical protein OXD47_02845 [Gammaproteobacteria bacterium]|nr:hypothetical protein [Gammaproteobacteria bacterium]MCY4337717.1 hypothetical protein [Gammaproteobacteria bacterium]